MRGSLSNDIRVLQTARWTERDGILWSPELTKRGVVAGFTTRALGSMGGRATAPDAAGAARAGLAARLGFDAVVRVKQVHGDVVVRVEGEFEEWPEADAMWTDRPNVLLGVVAADCVPVLVADDQGRVGAAHAGWEGTTRQVARRLFNAMRGAGSDPYRMVAALGPSIGPCCYKIDAARAATIRDRLGSSLASRALREERGRIVFDLWTQNAMELASAGLPCVEMSGTCTKCGGRDLWSYRGRDKGEAGTALGLGFIGRRA